MDHDLSSQTVMEANNWSFPSLNTMHTGQTTCGDGSDFYGWNDGSIQGTMEYTFSGSGTFDIEFGNCGTMGNVYLYYDDMEAGLTETIGTLLL